jgi:UDP-N-acetylmuramoyl-tripeptide--D-alanyl-D-alanine ligase
MFELGEESLTEHKGVIDLLLNQNDINCYFIGKNFYQNIISKSNFSFFENFEVFSKEIETRDFQNKMILIKGSRGMALERILDFL